MGLGRDGQEYAGVKKLRIGQQISSRWWFLSLCTGDIGGQVILCCGDCPGH